MYHLSQFARATPDKLAVHFLESGRTFTFAQLERQANRAANALLSLGLKQHDCVAPRHAEHVRLQMSVAVEQRGGQRGDVAQAVGQRWQRRVAYAGHVGGEQFAARHRARERREQLDVAADAVEDEQRDTDASAGVAPDPQRLAAKPDHFGLEHLAALSPGCATLGAGSPRERSKGLSVSLLGWYRVQEPGKPSAN